MDDKPKTGNPYPEPTKNVRYNSKGNDARWLQYELNRYGYKLLVDGIIGQRSIDALKDFQLSHGLEPDGICGPKTKQALLG
jgi:peptidoglycan hydrolase-like protein with peptidoglycan-binding domain